MRRLKITRKNRITLPAWRVMAIGLGLTMIQVDHAFAQSATTLGTMSTTATADMVDLSSWYNLIFWLMAGGFLVGAIYHAVQHRNGKSNVPLPGVALMVLLSGFCVGAPFLISASSRSLTGSAPSINQTTAAQPFAIQ